MREPVTSLLQLVVAARERFVRAGIPPNQAAIDAEVLARHLLEWDRATYLTRRDDPIAEPDRRRYDELAARRERREPVAYITGVREFWGREFLVSPAVLIPRPETEFIIEQSLARLADRQYPWRIADVGTGSGCIAVSLACELPRSTIAATDVSRAALLVARQNARRLGVADRVHFVHTSLLAGTRGPFDLIVANPPYVPPSYRPSLSADVRDQEPDAALFGEGADGLGTIRGLLAQVSSRLSPGARLLMEFGFDQADGVRAALAGHPDLKLEEILNDLQGYERTLVARLNLPDGPVEPGELEEQEPRVPVSR